MSIIDGGVAVGHFHKPPPFQRREHHEQIGDAIAFVFVIVTRLASWLRGDRRARLGSAASRSRRDTRADAADRAASDRPPARLPCWRQRPRWRPAESPIAA